MDALKRFRAALGKLFGSVREVTSDNVQYAVVSHEYPNKAAASFPLGETIRFTPAKRGPVTPLNLPRSVLLATYVLVTALSGAVVFGWPFMAKTLEYVKVYSWLCVPPESIDDDGLCNSQREALQFLLTVGVVTNFITGFIGGLVLHLLGPRFIGTLAAVMLLISCWLLAISSSSLQLYIPAFMLMGAMVELESFGILSITRLFPNRKGAVISFIFGFSDVSWWIPMLLYFVVVRGNVSLQAAVLAYSLIVALPIVLILYFTLPKSSYEVYEDEKSVELHLLPKADDHISIIGTESSWSDEILTTNEKESVRSRFSPLHRFQLEHFGDLNVFSPLPESQLRIYTTSSSDEMMAKKNSLIIEPRHDTLQLEHTIFNYTGRSTAAVTEKEEAVNYDSLFQKDAAKSPASIPADAQPSRCNRDAVWYCEKWPVIRYLLLIDAKCRKNQSYDDIFRIQFISFTMYFGWSAVRNVLFNNIIEEVLGADAEGFLGYALPFSFGPAVVAGNLIDYSPRAATHLHNSLAFLLYFFTGISYACNSTTLAYTTVVLYVLQNWNFTLMLSYVSIVYGNSPTFGKAAGTCYLVGGIMTYSCKYFHAFLHTGKHLPIILIAIYTTSIFFFFVIGRSVRKMARPEAVPTASVD